MPRMTVPTKSVGGWMLRNNPIAYLAKAFGQDVPQQWIDAMPFKKGGKVKRTTKKRPSKKK